MLLSPMLVWLWAASFSLSYSKGIFLLATALVSPGDSSSNNYGFVLCLCQTLTIHQLQLACFDVFSGDLDLMVYLAQK